MTFVEDVKRRDVISGLVALGSTGPRVVSAAPTVHALTVRQLVDASDLIADVVPTASTSRWVQVYGAQRIVTFWRLEVMNALVGQPSSELGVATLGGTVGHVQQWVPHEAALRPRARYLVFTRAGALETSWITGMRQGAFALAVEGGELRVTVGDAQRDFLEVRGSAVGHLAGLTFEVAARVIRAVRDT